MHRLLAPQLQLVAVAAVLASNLSAAASAPAAPIGLPSCTTSCGNVTVPYPFGISAECSHPGFNLTCDRTYHPPRLLLGDGSFQVKNIFLRNATAQVISAAVVDQTSNSNAEAIVTWGGFADGGPYMLSRNHNEFVLVGCNVQATLLLNGTNKTVSACSSFCSAPSQGPDIDDVLLHSKGCNCSKCSGSGCCQAAIPVNHPSYEVRLKRLTGTKDDGRNQPLPTVVLIAERGWFNVVWERMMTEFKKKRPTATTLDLSAVPVVLEWAIGFAQPTSPGNSSCPKDVASSACKSKDSSCCSLNITNRSGYTCRCSDGYDGNPYVTDGCQDIDECALPDKCFGECTNTAGGYLCRCPRGARGNPYVTHGCVKSSAGLSIGLGVGSSIFVSLLVFGGITVTRKLEAQRVKKTRQRFFVQNHGQLLSQRADISERMIITLEELEKATNNFDNARELGHGGQGTVYKGILSDLHVVAIKKPKSGIQREIDEFINEVAILSQINHRNIVRLFGCCLETEVPLLVYEFISNGTLYDRLHVEGPISLSWDDRLRVSIETARAVAYLHSAASTPIIHRDIKSSNILLDDTLTAKVSDFGASKHVPMDQTGVTTVVQGTIGYLDPMYYCEGRLTEKSDVYSFGVFLVELLTRKKPFSYRTSEGNGLAAHFSALFEEDNLVQILDPQVMEEGYNEAKFVAELAVACVKMNGQDRPTMRQVEMTLEGIRSSKQAEDNMVQVIFEGNLCSAPNGLLIEGGDDSDGLSQHYYTSLGEPFVLSPGYLEI